MQTYEQGLLNAKAFIEEHDDFLVVSHVQPDGDAVSSTVVVGWLLSCLGKKFTLVNEGPIPKRMHYLTLSDQIIDQQADGSERQYQHVICVDCADFKRVGLVSHWMSDAASILNIDHHPTNDNYGEVNLIKADAAATAEILYDWIECFDVKWTTEVAEAIYTGLLTDTGGFRYSSTSPKVMEIASRLLDLGVNGPDLAETLLEEVTLPQVKVLGMALSTLQLSEDGKIAHVHVTPEHMIIAGADNEDLEGIVNYPRNIQGVEVGIFFKVIDDHAVKASLRSAGKVNVAAVAQHFGGGGHIKAAGCRLEGTLEEVTAQVIQQVKESL
ncbi:bifunctional oligoribonuclease/PAP phosphatase NrnA [Paenibacillus sp. PsM32]|uniref:DHH family phosphoesterase n=1 Tax=Paenibacillus sp. PsM32 TaxID=3030536 RepID=UPI00263B29D0|nr:bifunctional oligoribonuclease/PAP phosphatase NrnA [Paenibacillus sp. PsM32]MDN4616505.1 bifunctional oligoribonuclease/PAP phosphatase NrnA [Paenibacillus sp. PsM32]